jgi:hypothetical protein
MVSMRASIRTDVISYYFRYGEKLPGVVPGSRERLWCHLPRIM